MNNNLELEKKKKIILITSIITLIILGIASSTIAYFGWFGEESSISVTVSGEGSCSVKNDNNIFLEPTATKEEGRIIKFTAEQGLAAEAYISWNMIVNQLNGLNDATFKYEMINTTTGKSYGSGNFEGITEGASITFSNETEKLSINTEYEFTLYLWIDGTIGNNPLSMAGQNLDFDMNCTISDGLDNETSQQELVGTWQATYDTVTSTTNDVTFEYPIEFSSNGYTFSLIKCEIDETETKQIYYGNELVYNSSTGWTNDYYKTITITEEPTNADVRNWILANYSEIAIINVITFTVNNVSYQAEENMTWRNWCNSGYNTDSFTCIYESKDSVFKNYNSSGGYVISGVFLDDYIILNKAYGTNYYGFHSGGGND